MYEHAAAGSAAPAALWHVGDGHALFAGPLGRNALDAHSVPVLLAGLYDTFRLRIDGGEWLSCGAGVVPVGVVYEFDLDGDPLGVLYLEPNIAGVDALAPLLCDTREVNRALVGRSQEVGGLRELYERHANSESIDQALQDLVRFSKARARRQLDARVARVVGGFHEQVLDPMPVAELARTVGLSSSRLQHLFAREVGVPLRRYRTWHRLRAAIREVKSGSSYTKAAHRAGFYDQSHFAREFRRTFGAPASRGLPRRRDHSPTRRA